MMGDFNKTMDGAKSGFSGLPSLNMQANKPATGTAEFFAATSTGGAISTESPNNLDEGKVEELKIKLEELGGAGGGSGETIK